MRYFAQLSWLLILFSSSFLHADEALIHKKSVQKFINNMVDDHGFERQKLISTLKKAQFQPKIIHSMNKPYEKKTWDVYKAIFLTPARVQKGLEFWKKNQKTLTEAEKRFGVPAHIIVAIIGVETLYGERKGSYRVLDALTTLAFGYPKRSAFFSKELREYLLLCKEQGVDADKFVGSYAGAIGIPQFMPSSYRFYAIDFLGKGSRDLMNDRQDAIGSVANYLHKHGWKLNDQVAQPATVQGFKYKKIKTNTRHADYEKKQLIAAGIMPKKDRGKSTEKAGLIKLMTQDGQEYWVAYPNFYVITRYNTSPQYALVVYLLSQQLNRQWTGANPGYHKLSV